MDFSGFKYATFDEKGRVVLPAEFKNAMGGKIIDGQMAVELDVYEKCLNIYPMPEWEKRIAMFKAKLNVNNPDESWLLDQLYQSFKLVPVADSGRMNFPNEFLFEKGITKDVVITGSGSRIRLWDVEEYKKYTSRRISDGKDFRTLFLQNFGNAEG